MAASFVGHKVCKCRESIAKFSLERGPRQSGKSTLVRLIRQDGYVTLDRATVRAGAGADPDGFVAGLPVPGALDEVQREPDLLLAVKAEIDEQRRPGRFLLTGSANVLMLPKVADALPGRMEIVELWPLSQGEIDSRPESFVDAVFEPVLPAVVVARVSRDESFDRVLCGGFPESLQRPVDRRSDWFESYLTAVVEREVRDLSNVGSVAELTVMIRLIAARAGRCSTSLTWRGAPGFRIARPGTILACSGPYSWWSMCRPGPRASPHGSFGRPSYS